MVCAHARGGAGEAMWRIKLAAVVYVPPLQPSICLTRPTKRDLCDQASLQTPPLPSPPIHTHTHTHTHTHSFYTQCILRLKQTWIRSHVRTCTSHTLIHPTQPHQCRGRETIHSEETAAAKECPGFPLFRLAMC